MFLKSTDDSMLDTLQKMSGTTHKAFTNSKTITRDMEKIVMKNEGKVSYTMSVQEVPVISYNDMAFISERNSIVFRAGDSPIWNRNETILPMSWRLFKDTITAPGKEYSLQTIPTLSSAVDFDVRRNQPDFQKMLDHRMKQAVFADEAMALYRESYGYGDYDIERLDPDNYSDEIMDLINRLSYAADNPKQSNTEEEMYEDFDLDDFEGDFEYVNDVEENVEQQKETANAQAQYDKKTKKIFAKGLLSPDDLSGIAGISHNLDKDIIAAYLEVKGDMWKDTDYFVNRNGSLYGVDGSLYIELIDPTESLNALNEASKDETSNVYSEGDTQKDEISKFNSYRVTDEFYMFLAHLDSWRFAKGRFDQEMYRRMMDK
ncbi:MAG: hypothetical protein U0L73_11910 [Ruminococcus bromii]|nr:hypothetical protein [Ruminococcus bromii]